MVVLPFIMSHKKQPTDKRYTAVNHFHLISRLAHSNDRFARLIGHLDRIMAKWQVTDCLSFRITLQKVKFKIPCTQNYF